MTYGEWQTIETAPKDGDVILLLDGKNVVAGYWGSAKRTFKGPSDKVFPWVILDETNGLNAMMEGGNSGPTHWMPLPPPPKGEGT